MFRQMMRKKQALTEEEAYRVVAEGKRAFLGVNGDEGYPYVIPMNYYYEPEDGKIYFHGAKVGHVIDAMARDDKVCFTVLEESHKDESGDFWYVNSVVVFGRTERVTDEAKHNEMLMKLGRKYFPDTAEGMADLDAIMARSGKRAHVTAITIENISGKVTHEK